MKLKKILSMLLVASMTFSFAACGNRDTASESTESAEAETSEETAEAEAAGETIECEPLEVTFATTYNQNDIGGILVQYFLDTASELTNGAISSEVWWSGTVLSSADTLEGLGNGTCDMTCFAQTPHTGTLNYLGFPSFAPGSDTVLEMFNKVIFEDEETSALVQQELADNGIYFLDHGTLPGGANAFCATFEFSDLDSLISGCSSFGNMDAAIFEKLGFQVTSVGPDGGYDALDRGLITATQLGLHPMVMKQWYAVAGYWALDGTYTAGSFISANLDWWNSLSAEQQEALQLACDKTVAYATEVYDAGTDEDIALVEEETGNEFVEFSDEDIARIWAANFDAKAETAMTNAEANGKGEGMEKILKICAEVTGYDWQP
ncbi:MAG: hypothetical protein K6G40_00515 [Eubacterium sp.]|nr:hypothetical protein [Eubacterium sp.]